MSSRRRNGFGSGFRYAFEGLWYVVSTQPNFRIHLAAAALVILMGVWLDLSLVSWGVLSLTIGGVLVTEVLNTAVETVVDLVAAIDRSALDARPPDSPAPLPTANDRLTFETAPGAGCAATGIAGVTANCQLSTDS